MKCELEGSNARVIAKAIQSLSKVGKELFIEADEHGLQMRTINSTQSAVGSIHFSRSMFDSFQLPSIGYCCCKIAMKPCLGVFRNMKQVEYCAMSIQNDRTKFQVDLRCKLETTKKALIAILDEQNITSAVPTDQSSNVIRGDHKLFTEISNNFNASEEELTLEAKSDILSAKNYIEGARVNDKFMRSQFKLIPNEFYHYQVVKDATITICIKEFRAFLLFAETLNAEIILEFDDAGCPLFLKIKKLSDIECLLILSTLSPDDVSFSNNYCPRDIGENDISSLAQKRKSSTPGTVVVQKRRLTPHTTLTRTNKSLFNFRSHQPVQSTEAFSVQPARLLAADDTIDLVEEEADEDAMLLAMSHDASKASSPEVCFVNTEDAPLTLIPQQTEDGGNENEIVPQSPEDKRRMRTIFSRCFQHTFIPREPSPNSQAYAANSDTED